MASQSYEQTSGFNPQNLQSQASQFPQHGAAQAGQAYEQMQGEGSEGHKATNFAQGYHQQTTTQGENFGGQARMNNSQGYGQQAMTQGESYEVQKPMGGSQGYGNQSQGAPQMQEYGHQQQDAYQSQGNSQQQHQYQQNQGGYQGEQGGYQGGQSGAQQQQSHQQSNGAGGPAQNPEQQDMITKILVRLEKKFGGERFTNPDNDAKNKAMNANIVKKISYGIKLIMQKAPGYAMKYLH